MFNIIILVTIFIYFLGYNNKKSKYIEKMLGIDSLNENLKKWEVKRRPIKYLLLVSM